ncbi:MAG: hypothetical protein OIF50_12770 [Flavobacteriaceae bacterium]|nr:hypothetical protein [Flavobacteriaceae bacterium]
MKKNLSQIGFKHWILLFFVGINSFNAASFIGLHQINSKKETVKCKEKTETSDIDKNTDQLHCCQINCS